MKYILPVSIACALFCGGCNKPQQNAASSTDQEANQLREDNQELGKLQADNKEVLRLRKENQEIHKLRGQYQELSRARSENTDLKKQMGKLGLATTGLTSQSLDGHAEQAAALLRQSQAAAAEAGVQVVDDKNIPQEGDEVFVDPKFLAVLLPDVDWTKLNRKEPIGIKALLNQQGIVLTNYQDLIARGITNYVVHRNYAAQATPKAETPANE